MWISYRVTISENCNSDSIWRIRSASNQWQYAVIRMELFYSLPKIGRVGEGVCSIYPFFYLPFFLCHPRFARISSKLLLLSFLRRQESCLLISFISVIPGLRRWILAKQEEMLPWSTRNLVCRHAGRSGGASIPCHFDPKDSGEKSPVIDYYSIFLFLFFSQYWSLSYIYSPWIESE